MLTNDLSDTGRADRDNYVQWLRFLWESYRACLEVRFTNESLYKFVNFGVHRQLESISSGSRTAPASRCALQTSQLWR